MRIRNALLAGLVAVVATAAPLPALAAGHPGKGCAHKLRDRPAHAPGKDRSAWLGVCGNTFFVEAGTADTTADTTADPAFTTTPTTNVPVDQAFALHSRPGSEHVLFLDFDGHLLTGTGWNDDFAAGADIAATPYDTDGSPGTFSATERTAVIAVFQRVAEDYAPFDLDVTTADPGDAAIDRTSSSDLQFGTRALITNTTLACGGCAGIAYLDVFDASYQHGYTQPALAFATELSGSAKLIAETVAHEVGHNLGLDHDGTSTAGYITGHGAWSAIMGASTNRPITQWSNGDYADANNPQDDIAVIAGNGAPLVPDDHGSSAATATPVAATATGLISDRADTDWFSFTTTGGPVSVTATPSAVGADLDLRVDLLNAAGALVGSVDPASSTTYADPPTGLGSTLSLTVPAGSYVIRLDGVGSGDPLGTGYSDYGSIGRYDLAVSAPTDGAPLVSTPTVTTTGLLAATRGRPYATQLAATGVVGTSSWSSGVLPAGLTLSSTGRLAGTPTVAGTFSLIATITDVTGGTASRTLSLRVNLPVLISTATVPSAHKGRAYAVRVTTAGGTAILGWRVYAGTLPTGMRFSNGVLSGTPTILTVRNVTFQVTDARGAVARRTFRVAVI